MMFAVDIDGTIAGRNMALFSKTCNERFELGLSHERLAGIKYASFIELPELQAYRSRVGDQAFHRSIAWLELEPEMLAAAPVFPGALAGLECLARIGDVAYYTARHCRFDAQKSNAMEEATRCWLAMHQFSEASSIVFCENIASKLQKLARHIQETQEHVVLIDDSYAKLLDEYQRLGTEDAELLREHMTLAAFKADEAVQCYGLRCIAMPSWRHLDCLLNTLGLVVVQ